MRFTNRRALVTGAASGIGLAVVGALVHEGIEHVVAVDLAAPTNPLMDTVQPLQLDVSNEADWRKAAARLGPLDIVVASAGIADACPIAETSLEQWRRVMNVNLDGVFLTLRYTASLLREGASVVLIGSASGIKAAAGTAAYASSKAAVGMLAKVAALEWKPRGIRVNVVSPAGVVTPIWTKAPFWQQMVDEGGGEEGAWKALGKADASVRPLDRMAYPQEVARAVLFVLSDDAGGMTGTELVIDSGYTI